MEFSFLVCLIVLIQESVSFTTWKTHVQCELDANTLYPWLVSIWFSGNDEGATTGDRYGQGVLITYKAVLTACSPSGDSTTHRFSLRYTPSNVNKFYVYGQRINVTGLITGDITEADAVICDTQRAVTKYVEHPKCRKENTVGWDHKEVEELFNFAGFVLKEPMTYTGNYYPTLPLPLNAEDLIGQVSYLNIMEGYGCEILWFEPRGAPTRHPVIGQPPFIGAPLVKSIPFQSQCLHFLCEEKPNTEDAAYKKCKEFHQNRANATRLCMQPKWTKSLTGTFNGAIIRKDAYIGAPLVCNGTGYGHVSYVKLRHGIFAEPNDSDFFFVTTYVRALPWIKEFKKNWTHTTPEWYIEQQDLQTEEVRQPIRAAIEDEVIIYHQPRLPYGAVGPGYLKQAPVKRSEGIRTGLHPFIGPLVISGWLAISNSG